MSKAVLDHFHNFLHELSAKLADFLLIAVKGPLNTLKCPEPKPPLKILSIV